MMDATDQRDLTLARCAAAMIQPTNTLTIGGIVPKAFPLLSFDDAKRGGEAMYDRFTSQSDDPAPMSRDDAGWADMFRAGYEAIRK